jgi:hypothetical protein
VYDTTHAPGEPWFSLEGRVLDPEGKPVCGALVSIRYIENPELPNRESLGGAVSFSGLGGEYFLDNIRKGVQFQIVVNPYWEVELHARREGLEAVPALVKERNLRSDRLARYTSEALTRDEKSGLLSMDIPLVTDESATGVLLGTAGPLDGKRPINVRVSIVGWEAIETGVNPRTGAFAVFGVPSGRITAQCEVQRDGHTFTARAEVTVGSGKKGPTNVEVNNYVLTK